MYEYLILHYTMSKLKIGLASKTLLMCYVALFLNATFFKLPGSINVILILKLVRTTPYSSKDVLPLVHLGLNSSILTDY